LVLHKFNNASDAGGVDGKPGDPSQLILASDRMPSASTKTKVSILSWRSAKLKGRVTSTLASEALAFSQALGELEWIQVMFRDIVFNDIDRKGPVSSQR